MKHERNFDSVNISSLVSKHNADYLSGHFLISDTDQDYYFFTPDYPVIINDIVFGICVRGHGEVSLNLTAYPLEENDLLILLPGSILEYNQEDISNDFLLKFVSFSLEFVNSLELSNLFTSVKRNPSVRCSEEEASRLLVVYADLQEKSGREHYPYKKEIIQYTLMAAIFEFYAIYEQKMLSAGHAERNKDVEFQAAFFDLVYAHYRTRHQMEFYAEKLFLTPKYLSAKIKVLTNKSANEWINEFLILEAKSLLKSTDMAIKEIAYRLGFPDASTFGKFFRKYVEITPKQYRQE